MKPEPFKIFFVVEGQKLIKYQPLAMKKREMKKFLLNLILTKKILRINHFYKHRVALHIQNQQKMKINFRNSLISILFPVFKNFLLSFPGNKILGAFLSLVHRLSSQSSITHGTKATQKCSSTKILCYEKLQSGFQIFASVFGYDDFSWESTD